MATLVTRFDLGQEVVGIASAHATRVVFCQTCNREGVVTIGGETFTCPKCNGTSKHPRHVGQRWYVSERSVVGKLDVCAYLRQDQYDHKNEIRYMLEATGVGSGRLWDEADLFATEQDALAECAKRNANKVFEDE